MSEMEHSIHQRYRFAGIIAAFICMAAMISSPVFARHGEEGFLTNRIPEPAPYVVSETTANADLGGVPGDFAPPPFEDLWNGINDTGSCSGCHTGLFDQWNGSMMANAWRDPGWRGAFLLVARLTSTDGCNDTIAALDVNGLAPDGTQGYDCTTDGNGKLRAINPFSNADGTSTFDMGAGNLATYSGSGALTDDFCSRCHMPTNYIDATVAVSLDAPSGQEHGSMSPTFDPTSTNGTTTATDPVYGTALESFAERFDGPRPVNTNSGKAGIICEICHTNVDARYTPYHNYVESGVDYYAATKDLDRDEAGQLDQFGNSLPADHQDMITVPDAASPNLGYALGAGAYRLSAHALNMPERFGPLSWNDFTATVDTYISDTFSGGGVNRTYYFEQANPPGKHDTYYSVKYERAEFCAGCHDVTNPITIKNEAGNWVGGFPIERTYTEFRNSRYANRPGNDNFDPNFQRDCQTCHMQQSFGEAGTALTLYAGGVPDEPLTEPSCDRIIHNPGYSHHFVGGNGYVTKMIGADLSSKGDVEPYPQLLETSFTSTEHNSRFNSARFDTSATMGAEPTQHVRFAWDRLRNALTMSVSAPASVAVPASESVLPLNVVIANDGAGHNFPTGFPEGRNAWVKVSAWDTRNTADTSDDVELEIETSVDLAGGGSRTTRSLGVGNLTTTGSAPGEADLLDDVNFLSSCGWHVPPGSPDIYAYQFRAVASLDKACPTLALPYATPINLVVNADGMPTDANGVVIDRDNPTGLPRYADLDGDGDLYDDSFLIDTRLSPQPLAGATLDLDRHSVVVPSTVVGPIAVTAVVYYQSFEAVVAQKFLGNLANLDDVDADEGYSAVNPDGKPVLEPCVLKGPCDRAGKAGATGEIQLRTALKFDPAVVDGAPAVPMKVANAVIQVTGTTDNVAPTVVINNYIKAGNKQTVQDMTNDLAPIPANGHWSPSPYGGQTGDYTNEDIGEEEVDGNRIVKISFSEPVAGVDLNTLYLTDGDGTSVSALLDQIDETTWALFPFASADAAFLDGRTYVLHVAPSNAGSSITDFAGNTLAAGPDAGEWTFGFSMR